MEKSSKISTVIISFTLMVCLSIISATSVYAWFNGQGYVGKTMSYSRNIYIGATDSSVTNYYGYMDAGDNFVYAEINPTVGFQQNNLIPSSFVHIRTDIQNSSATKDLFVSLYLQNMEYDSSLHDYIYIGINDPIITREIYKDLAIYDSEDDTYTIKSIPLISSYTVQENSTVSIYWYVYIDSDAGMDVASAYISLGDVVLGYNS